MPFQYPPPQHQPPQGHFQQPQHVHQQQQQHLHQQQQPQRSQPYYYDELLPSWPLGSPCGPPYQRPNVVETKYIVKKNGPMGTSNQANAAASFFAKAHQKLQLNNNGLHDLRNVGGGCSPAASRRPLLQNNNAT